MTAEQPTPSGGAGVQKPRSSHPLAGGNVFPPRARELMAHLDRGARLRYAHPWTVETNGRRIDVLPNALAVTWIRRGLVALSADGAYEITDAGRRALAAEAHGPRPEEGA